MQSKKRKTKSAYRRGERMVSFFKKCIIVFSILIILSVIVLSVRVLARTFPIKKIMVSGNYYLEHGEIKDILHIREGESFFRLSFNELESRLKRTAWIRKVVIRKQFPDTLMIKIDEAVPKALLRFNGKLFLVDTRGNVLEEIVDESTPFLPVIMEIDPKKDRGGILEAMKLIKAIEQEGIFSRKESIRIMMNTYGLAIDMDGELVKVGFGEYTEKLGQWRKLEEKIKSEHMPVEYIDLRFKDSVIVKPVKNVEKSLTAKIK